MKKYIKNNQKSLVFAIAFSLLSAILAVSVQFLKGKVLDYALSKNFTTTLKYGIYLFIFILLELFCFYLYDRLKSKFIVDAMKELRIDYMHSLLTKSFPDFLKKKKGEYIAQYTNEMELIETKYFNSVPIIFEIIIKILIVSLFLFALDPRIAIVTLFLLTTPLYVPKIAEKQLQKAQMEFIDQFEDHVKKITDWLDGFEIIKNFSIENNIKNYYINTNDILMKKNLNKRLKSCFARALSAMLSYASHFAILIFAAYLVLQGEFTAGDFFVAVGLIDQLSYPIISLSYFIQDLIAVKPVTQSIVQFNQRGVVCNKLISISKEEFKRIIFDDVTFAYQMNEEVLHNMSLAIHKNKHYLFQGVSGSGKTTCINLLLNYYEPNAGIIAVNDVAVGKIKNLTELITVMRQDAILVADTLRNNITMYQEYSDDAIISVLIDVGLSQYACLACLDMKVEEGGKNFSGGEKRRITLARSILRKTPILILDEPLANLDEQNAQSIESLLLGMKGKTLIVISHQFSLNNRSKFDEIIEF